MKDKYEKLYKEANRIIGDKTPLKKDCGTVCGAACCKGDKDTGMLLFPFEETTLTVNEKDGVRLAVCDGKCKREERGCLCNFLSKDLPQTPQALLARVNYADIFLFHCFHEF